MNMWQKVTDNLQVFSLGAIVGCLLAILVLVVNMDIYGIKAHKQLTNMTVKFKSLIRDFAPYYGDENIKAILERNGVRFETKK